MSDLKRLTAGMIAAENDSHIRGRVWEVYLFEDENGTLVLYEEAMQVVERERERCIHLLDQYLDNAEMPIDGLYVLRKRMREGGRG